MNSRATALELSHRRTSFAALEAETFDILVIGAGITGCGIARDAAMRGLRVALIDANDIGAGTSSRSSKLIHGGLRYLAQGQVGVVREAANERRTLRRIAPHLARTNPMVILAKSKKGIATLRAAMWSYEKLGKVDKHEHHEVWDTTRLRAEEPRVVADDLAGAVVYPEYLTDDSRLTLGNARSAANHGAVVVTYAAAEELIVENGRAAGAIVRGALPGEEEGARIRARAVVNAAGPWVDAVRRLEDSGARDKLQLTKGIHVVFHRSRVPVTRTIIMNTPDKRSIFAVPREGFVYLGTTDTFYPGPEYWPEITAEDVDYLLETAGRVLDAGPFRREEIVAVWSGLRPLLGAEGKKPSEIPRRDEVMEGPGSVLSIAGGKLTSYRSMAERLIDQCEKKLGRKPKPPPTAEEPLPGGDFARTFEDLQSRLENVGLTPHEAERATRLYGSEATGIFAQGNSVAAEAAHAVLQEGALTLEDYWVRRSARCLFDEEGGLAALERAAERMAELLHWSEAERARQVEACRARRTADIKVLEER